MMDGQSGGVFGMAPCEKRQDDHALVGNGWTKFRDFYSDERTRLLQIPGSLHITVTRT